MNGNNARNDDLFPVKISDSHMDESYHWHKDLEIVCVIQGKAQITINNNLHIVTEDRFAIINMEDVHRIEVLEEPFSSISFHINSKYFDRFIKGISNVFFMEVIDDKTLSYQIRKKFAQILLEYKNKRENYEDLIIYNVTALLSLLCNNLNQFGKNPGSFRNTEQFDRIWSILDYIYKNYTKKITLTEAARHVHISESYLSHSIKKNTGMSFETWINYVRAENSIKLLLKTDMSITRIAYECGFSEPKYFNNFFEKFFQCKPAEYRLKNKIEAPSSSRSGEESGEVIFDNLLMKKINEYILGKNHTQKPYYKGGSINIEVTGKEQGVPFPKNWKKWIDIGDYRNVSNIFYLNSLKEIQEEIGFESIQIRNLFDQVRNGAECGEGTINWYEIDSFLNILGTLHLKPFFEIPADECESEKFQEYFSKFIDGSVKKYGAEVVQSWRFQLSVTEQQASDINNSIVSLKILKKMAKAAKVELDFQVGDRSQIKDNLLYDTLFMASYAIETILADERYDCIYKSIFDQPGEEIFYGGSGLITANGLKKPLYYAYYLLSLLGTQIIGKGENYCVAKSEEGIQILMFHPSRSITEESIDEIEVEEENRYFNFILEKEIKFDLKIGNLGGSDYKITRLQLNRKNGSIFDLFHNEQSLRLLTAQEKEYINKICRPMISFDFLQQCQTIRLKSKLDPNSAELILLQKR